MKLILLTYETLLNTLNPSSVATKLWYVHSNYYTLVTQFILRWSCMLSFVCKHLLCNSKND